ncbi:MAG TPA: single-stranded-DNA-specific exonuclease RecJ, partial [Candidatus Woesebacteria bacterium]|nr:single-stranded-DNA-specific exonuclease RecJ [Candidatus Woesebacteria bacterium]
MRKIKLKSNKIITVDTSVKELITILLKNRQILSKDAREFLFPPYPQPSLAGLIRAVARIKKAIRNKENILVYGDYDVDGLTAT